MVDVWASVSLSAVVSLGSCLLGGGSSFVDEAVVDSVAGVLGIGAADAPSDLVDGVGASATVAGFASSGGVGGSQLAVAPVRQVS